MIVARSKRRILLWCRSCAVTLLVIGMGATAVGFGPALAQASGSHVNDDLNAESRYDRFIPRLKPSETIMAPKKNGPVEPKKRKEGGGPDEENDHQK